MADIDLDELERLARAAQEHLRRWPADWPSWYAWATGPEVLLPLIERLRRAEAYRAVWVADRVANDHLMRCPVCEDGWDCPEGYALIADWERALERAWDVWRAETGTQEEHANRECPSEPRREA